MVALNVFSVLVDPAHHRAVHYHLIRKPHSSQAGCNLRHLRLVTFARAAS